MSSMLDQDVRMLPRQKAVSMQTQSEGMRTNAEGLGNRSVFISQAAWQPVAEVCRMVYKLHACLFRMHNEGGMRRVNCQA